MSLEAWLSLAIVIGCVGLLALSRIGADLILMAGLTAIVLLGIVPAKEAFAGFANEGMLTVGILYVVVAGLQETGAVAWIGQYLFGRAKTILGAQARMMVPVAALSAFLNNTPLVAMLIPVVSDWSRKYRIPASKLMLPLSYATILGGTCSLIGTSTNLVLSGLIISETDLPAFGMFTISKIGIPSAIIGLIFILLTSRWLLPDRQAAVSSQDDLRNYTVDMQVEANGPLVAKSIEQAGLRQLPGAFLAEIERKGRFLEAVAPQEVLVTGDILRFVGVAESVVDLRRIRGLVPATDQVGKLETPTARRRLVEAVVSNSCPLIGKTIREGRFRTIYNAVVIAVARGGERLKQKIGDIVLEPGDQLLLETQPSFAEQQRNSKDFYLVSPIENSNPPRHDRAGVALFILLGMIVLVTFGMMPMLQAALLAAGLMIVTRCVTGSAARSSVNFQVLTVIAASFALGRALELTGAAEGIAGALSVFAGDNPWPSLVIIYGVTMLFTELITNNAAAVLMFPIALATASGLGVSPIPFVIAIMMAASASFSTPIGYQTNLMVYGPGGYRFSDYFKIGIPLNLLMWLLSSVLIPIFYKF